MTDEVRRIALRCGEAFGLGLYGLDIIESPDGPSVVDVNYFPGYKGIARAPEAVASYIARYAQGRTPPSKSIILVFLGSTDPPAAREGYREIPVRILDDPAAVADVYRAADLYLHAARSESFISFSNGNVKRCALLVTMPHGMRLASIAFSSSSMPGKSRVPSHRRSSYRSRNSARIAS